MASGATRGGGGAIAIVDDDPALRLLTSSVLEDAGYATWTAATGEDALREARRTPPALVVLDVRLPRISGYEVCHELRSSFGEALPILFISGERTEPFDRVAGLLIGGDDYLVKPFAPDELLARVRVLLRRRNGSAAPKRNGARLTRRELDVLSLLAGGLGQRQIAEQLVISPKTVGTHIEHVLRKLGVHSRAQAVAAAYRDGLLDT